MHRQVRQERRLGGVQHDLDGVVIDLVHRLEQLGHAHVAKVGVVGTGDLEVGVVLFPLALEHEQDVVGVHVARGLEVFVGLPFHAFAQVKGVFQAVLGNGPAFSQARHDLGAATLEVDQVVVNLLTGIKGGAGGVDAGGKIFRAAFGAVHQRLGPDLTYGQQRQDAQRRALERKLVV